MQRRQSRKVKVGNIYVGGDSAITVQSMLNRPASDIEGSVKQAVELEKAGCEIIRAAVPDMAAVRLIEKLKENLSVPVVADIHFDYRLALASLEAGVDKIRINPGNIGSIERVRAVANACKAKQVPIRIGVNSGSLEKELLDKYGSPCARALAESAMKHVELLEMCDFNDIIISIKSSSVQTMVDAYKLVAAKCDYPLHLGVTEAGTHNMALIKSSIGIGSLLLEGIGDTIRVSMTDDPVKEVAAANGILKAIGLKTDCVDIVSCPTCGRTKI
ncbi:MAG: flavodoxin-dependent (E)-4-hydroxy-3-methylbut-2-enyl-diphosphate synthase, partial [Clostridia bacterium]|nr:flavodoxin-dependent (E)-4-hydroxy-3-methylbut-2-enyl-diphosphate synthase [Clostridia bacterium]